MIESTDSLPAGAASPGQTTASEPLSPRKSPPLQPLFPGEVPNDLSIGDSDAKEQLNDSSQNKDGPTDLRKQTIIHHLAANPDLRDPLGEENVPSDGVEDPKVWGGSFSLPRRQDSSTDCAAEHASFCGGPSESGAEVTARARNGVYLEVDQPVCDFHHFASIISPAAGDIVGKSAIDPCGSIALGARTKTGHIYENARAMEVMIAPQGTEIRTAAAALQDSNPPGISRVDKLVRSHRISDDDDAISAGFKDWNSETVPNGRVDVDKLEVVETPLSRIGRITFIKGRLPDTNPFMRAAQNLGYFFLSIGMKAAVGDLRGKHVSEEDRERLFMRDVETFNRELGRDFKIPIIGGSQLNLYSLTTEVMKLGGLEPVVQNRAFQIVAQQLGLPKSCTSAAFVLKNVYEKLIYMYEQKLAFGINPTNPLSTIDMRFVLSGKKMMKKNGKGGKSHHPQTQVPSTSTERVSKPLVQLPGRITKRSTLDSTATLATGQLNKIRHPSTSEFQMSYPEQD